jgi:hypothetical protein
VGILLDSVQKDLAALEPKDFICSSMVPHENEESQGELPEDIKRQFSLVQIYVLNLSWKKSTKSPWLILISAFARNMAQMRRSTWPAIGMFMI